MERRTIMGILFITLHTCIEAIHHRQGCGLICNHVHNIGSHDQGRFTIVTFWLSLDISSVRPMQSLDLSASSTGHTHGTSSTQAFVGFPLLLKLFVRRLHVAASIGHLSHNGSHHEAAKHQLPTSAPDWVHPMGPSREAASIVPTPRQPQPHLVHRVL